MSNPTPTAAYQNLLTCVMRIASGPWHFIQLRGTPLGAHAVDGDDVDLLGSRTAINELLDAAFGWVRAGECHLRIQTPTPAKTALTLFSSDGQHRVEFDLWVELWQLKRRTQYLRYETLAPLVQNPTATLQRLPPDLEATIYIHHLLSKRKDLTAAQVAHRLMDYETACHQAGHFDLAQALQTIRHTKTISPAAEQWFNRRAEVSFSIPPVNPTHRRWVKVRDSLRQVWLGGPRPPRIISLMGCDGSGKTTLAHELVKAQPDLTGVFTGKHLYRKSWGYKLLVILIRPLLFQDRERFDETFAPIAYLRACLGLRWKLWRQQHGGLLLDRSLADFLFVGRKTKRPQFCRSRWLFYCIGRRIPVIHLVLPYEVVVARKQEMTRVGHAIYDTSMFQHYSRLVPGDYLAFNNQGDLASAVSAAGHLLLAIRPQSAAPRSNSADRQH